MNKSKITKEALRKIRGELLAKQNAEKQVERSKPNIETDTFGGKESNHKNVGQLS